MASHRKQETPLEILAIKQALDLSTIAFQVGGGYVIKLPAIAYKGVREVLQAAIALPLRVIDHKLLYCLLLHLNHQRLLHLN